MVESTGRTAHRDDHVHQPARNYALEREPEDLYLGRPDKDCDWSAWYSTKAYAGSRPSNELLQVPSLRDMAFDFRRFVSQPNLDKQDIIPELLTLDFREHFKARRRDYLRRDRHIIG